MGFRFFLQVYRTHAGFDGHVHAFFIEFNDFVEPFHTQDQATADGDGAVCQTRAATADGNGEMVFVGQLDNLGNFFGIGRDDSRFRQMEPARVRFVVCLVLYQDVLVGFNIRRASNGLELFDDFRCDGLIGFHDVPPVIK